MRRKFGGCGIVYRLRLELYFGALMSKSLAPPAESLSSLMTRAPELYDSVSSLLQEGYSPGGVAALTGVHVQTVRAVRELVQGAIHAAIRKMGYDLVEAAQKAAARLVDEIDQVPVEKLPQALAILLDKSLLLNGAPTQRVSIEHTKVLSREQLLAMYDSLGKKAKGVEVERLE
jgi:hypothetical protein